MQEILPRSEITGGHRLPLDLCRRHEAFVVSAGHADIFAIKRGGDGQEGRKHHLFRIEQGAALLGFAPLPGDDLHLIAVGGLETRFLPAAIGDLAPAAIRSWTERLDQTARPPADNTLPPAEPEEIHRRTLRAIAERLALEARQEQDLIERRARRNGSLAARLLSVLASVAAAQVSVTHPTAPGGPIAALLPLARRLGLDEILSRQRRGSDTPSDDIEGIERQLGRLRLRRRRVQLRPGWEDRTDDPLVGWLNDRGPVSLLPGKPWLAASDEASAPLTSALRERIGGTGLQLYRRLPDRKTGFGDLLAMAADVSRADLARILLAGAGAALIGFFLPVATALLFDEVVPNGERGALASITLGLVAAALGGAVFQAWRGIALVRLETRIEGITQSALVDRLLGLPARFFRRFSVGDLTDRLLGVQEARRILGDNALSAILSLFFSLASLGIMAVYSARLALVALALVLLTAIADIGLSWGQLRHERRRMRSLGQLDGFLLQLIVGIGKLRVAAAESRAAAQWAARFARQRNHYRAARRWTAAQETVQTVIPGVAQIILYGAMMATLQGDGGASRPITTGAFIAVTAAFGQLMAAFGAAVRALTRTISAVPLIERARPILESEPDRSIQTEAPDDLTGRIDLRQISFRYAPDLPLVLDGLNLGIKAGEFVALVGGSGSGKSTLLRLLLGFERPDQGEIYFDDRPAGRLDPVALNRLCGVVLQNGGLSSGSILENIVGPAPVDMQRAWEAAAMAGLDQDIRDMPMGMHTMLTDGAAALSGGQRQRLLIARALVHRPRFLFFDEATSALDNRTQAVVTDTLARLQVTRIVIAHRLTTIRNVDRIFVLERGRVAQSGNYEELMAQDGPFVQLARRQLI